MNTSTSRFFIALLPPQDIQDYVTSVKHIFADRYNSRAALKSPPHITLQPPFEWPREERSSLEQPLQDFANQQAPVLVTLSGFGAFVPRVVYINVLKTPELLTMQQALMAHVEAHLGIIDPVSKTRAFAPHMTVGYRDLTKPNFKTAWSEFEHQPLQFEFVASHLTLLIHDGARWNIAQEFPFAKPLA